MCPINSTPAWQIARLLLSFNLSLILLASLWYQAKAGVLSAHTEDHKSGYPYVRRLIPGDIIEGDIKAGPELIPVTADHLTRGAIVSTKRHSFLWPSETVGNKRIIRIPYELRRGVFDGLSSTAQEAVEKAFEYLTKKTCVRFVPKKTTDEDFVEIFPGSGCWSEIGRRTRKQQISIGSGCEYRGKVLHELMHTMGFLHEQSRQDRDKYVKVLWENIDEQKHSEFKKRPQITDALPYDFKSVMHYRNKVFSNNGQDTISALNDPGVVLGKKHDLSALDIVRVNKLYSCSDHLSRDLVNYPVIVYTSSDWWSGTDAIVDIEIVGQKGDSGESDLATGGNDDDFERGSVHSFLFASPYLGTPKKLKIRLIKRSWMDGWKLSKVIIEDPRNQRKYAFKYDNWIYPGNHKILEPST